MCFGGSLSIAGVLYLLQVQKQKFDLMLKAKNCLDSKAEKNVAFTGPKLSPFFNIKGKHFQTIYLYIIHIIPKALVGKVVETG